MKSARLILALGLAGLVGLNCSSFAHANPRPAAPFPALDTSGRPDTTPAPAVEPTALPAETITIPGPLRSFLRMAGISQQISPEGVLPLVAYNVYTLGYQSGRQTEFLLLLDRYVQQARELQAMAGEEGRIHITGCSQAGPLLEILGYRLRETCGQKNAALITSNAERAFLTSDSGFPLTTLEEALETNTPFSYPYSASSVPVLMRAREWTSVGTWKKGRNQNLLDMLLHDPNLSRLYWAFSRMDPDTRLDLRRSPGLKKLLPYAAVLDFYGSQITIRSGRVVVPGGTAAEQGWRELVGANPQSTGEFVLHLVERNRGWLAAYFDVLSRVNRQQQLRLTESPRLRNLFDAFRSPDPKDYAAAASFRKAPMLLILFTRLQWGADGQMYVPGNLQTWQQILAERTASNIVRDWGRHFRRLDTPAQLLETMVAFTRVETDDTPLQIYLTLSEIDRERAAENRLSPGTVLLLANHFSELGSWEPLFSEFPALNDTSISLFVNTADSIDRIDDHALRANALGIFQANIGLWQILARQGQIPENKLNDTWQGVMRPFAKITSSAQLYDTGSETLRTLSVAAGGPANPSEDEIIGLLAGPPQQTPDGQRMHTEIADRIRSVLAGQRLVSLDTILPLGDGLRQMAQGAAPPDALMPLAEDLRSFQMPQPIFTRSEKSEWAPGIYENRHVDVQTRTDLTKVIKTPPSRAKLEEARGELTLYLRDTLVGLNYAYYEPPGAQVLHNNPLFVRSHDFTGDTIGGLSEEPCWQPSEVTNAGTPAGGGAYLIGSLSDLPYALASTEEDFLAPQNVQALVWKEVVPELLVSATLPRWWNVTPNELHAVALYQEAGEELLRASAGNEELRGEVAAILSERMSPLELDTVINALRTGHVDEILTKVTPADTFYLTAEFRKQYPGEAGAWGPKGKELESLAQRDPAEVNWDRISRDFGVPHPVLSQTYSRELLDVQPFPAFEGDSSRLFGETWDSNNLYWARLVDQMGYSPVMLNRLVPILTRQMVTNIFASQFEDWPAVLRAMRLTGERFLQGKIGLPPATTTTTSLR